MIKVNNIKLSIFEDSSILGEKIANKLKISIGQIKEYRIIKESVDARKKDTLQFVYQVAVSLHTDEKKVLTKLKSQDVMLLRDELEKTRKEGETPLLHRPIVIGSGPAGLFASLILAQKGFRPILLERGDDVETRTNKVQGFWYQRELDTESNVQFGEGGAGTFSDGKLTTRIKDLRCQQVLNEFVIHGAPEKIRYIAKPHIGTDILKDVVKNMRSEIIELGGEVHFRSKVTDFIIRNDKICGVIVNEVHEIPADVVVLAIGHSARDTYEVLAKHEIDIEQKPFSIGVRIEHPQELIDRNQYGEFAGHPKLGAADYVLTHQSARTGRGVYSFCMCPGGIVVGAASEENTVVTNGMSEFARNRENANSALVVTVGPRDFNSVHPLAGIEFQRKWERLAFETGGSNYSAPIQTVGDFIDGRKSVALGKVETSYTGGVTPTDLRQTLPSYVCDTMVEGLQVFDNKIKGYAAKDIPMIGVETRTSSPIRILRNDEFMSTTCYGLYPTGEGAGYAGGIMSAAVDGIKIAESIIGKFKRP